MGASLVYLEKPNTEIQFNEDTNSKIRCVSGEMQGWRLNMVKLNFFSRFNLITFNVISQELKTYKRSASF